MLQYSQPEVDQARLARVLQIGLSLNSRQGLESYLTRLTEGAVELTNSAACGVFRVDRRKRKLTYLALSGSLNSPLQHQTLPMKGSVAQAALTLGEPYSAAAPRHQSAVGHVTGHPINSIVCVPIVNEGRLYGIVEVVNKKNGLFSAEDTHIIVSLALWAGIAFGKERLANKLRSANDKLDELENLRNEFIATASMELQSPLAIIMGYLTMLREEVDPDIASQLDRVLLATTRLRALVQDMLNLRYIDAGQTELDLAAFDFVKLIRNFLDQNRHIASSKRQKIGAHWPKQSMTVIGDKRMLELVFNNLLNNASKFSPPESQIDIHIERKGNEVWLRVIDKGVGIPKDKLVSIFGRFMHVEPTLHRTKRGMGLGLAIANDLVSLHEGKIWVNSKLNEGSEFIVALPLAKR